MKRFLLVSLLIVVALTIGGAIFLRIYLRSTALAQKVGAEIEALYGGPVAIGSVDVGINQSALTDVAMFEPESEMPKGETTKDPPWLKIGSVSADVSLWALMSKTALPSKVTLRDATVTLRFDADGRLVTRLPEFARDSAQQFDLATVPEVILERGELVLRKQGHPDLVAKNVNLSIRRNDAGKLMLTGDAQSPDLGRLLLAGSIDPESRKAEAHIKPDAPVRVAQELLERLPFIPAVTWQEVQIADGNAEDLDLTVRYDAAEGAAHFHAETLAKQASVRVPSMELTAHDVQGRVVVDDARIELRDARGKAYGGDIAVSGSGDFSVAESELDFTQITVKNLNVQEVPESWHIPAWARTTLAKGKLTGQATLHLTIDANGTHARSTGKGTITDVSGGSAEFELKLAPRGARPAKTPAKAKPDAPAQEKTTVPLEMLLAAATFLQGPDSSEANRDIRTTVGEAVHQSADVLRGSLQDVLAIGSQLVGRIPRRMDTPAPKPLPPDAPGDYLDINLKLKDVDIAQFVKSLGVNVPIDVRGKLSFQVKASIPSNRAGDLKAYRVKGSAQTRQLVLAGVKIAEVTADIKYTGGVLELTALNGRLGETVTADKHGTFHGSGKLQVVPLGELTADLVLDHVPMTALADLAPDQPAPEGTVSGQFSIRAPPGKLQDLAAMDGRGLLQGEGLAMAGVSADKATTSLRLTNGVLSGEAITTGLRAKSLQVARAEFHWAATAKQIELSEIDVRLYGGRINGSAVVPLQPELAGSLDLRLSKLEAKELVKDLDVAVKVEGAVEGQLKGILPPAPDFKSRTANFDLNVTAPKLRVQNIPTEKLRGKLGYKNGIVDYKLEGNTLGGTFELEGQVPSAAPEKKETRKGRLRIDNLSLARLAQAFRVEGAVPVTGRLSVELDYTHDTPDRLPQGNGKLRIERLRIKDTELVTNVEGDLELSDAKLRLRNIAGAIAQGTFQAALTYNFRDSERSFVTLALDDVEAAELLAPWLGDKIKGAMQVHVRGNLGAAWHGTVDAELPRGEVMGLEVSQWRLPARWQYSPGTGSAQVEITETTAQAARGRLVSKLNANWDGALRMDGNVKLSEADVQTLLRPFLGPTELGGGKMTGRFEFSGSAVQSINDLNGPVTASFNQPQLLHLPMLNQVAPFIGTGPTTTFQRGELKARLDRGVLRIQQLALTGGNLAVHIDGTVNLEGRLNLNVVARNGDVGLPTLRLGAIGLRLPIAGPVPVVLLQEASNALANRVIYVEVTGTARNPTVRVRPLQILSEEAVRFFVNRANLPVPVSP